MTALQQRSPLRSERLVASVTRRVAALRVGPTAAVAGAIALVVTWLGSWNPSFWGDEAATVMSAQRPIASLFAELQQVDAVHGLYYLFMHFWIGAFGPSELSARFPSAIAVGLVVAGTVVLGSRLAGLRFGILTGLVCRARPTWRPRRGPTRSARRPRSGSRCGSSGCSAAASSGFAPG